MKIKTSGGTILESFNPLGTEQWKKMGYKELNAEVNTKVAPVQPKIPSKTRKKET